MIATRSFINKLVAALNRSDSIRTRDTARVEFETGYGESIVRYEDLNEYTHSIHFVNGDCQIGYFDNEGTYHWFSTMYNLSDCSNIAFVIDLSNRLYRMGKFIEEL